MSNGLPAYHGTHSLTFETERLNSITPQSPQPESCPSSAEDDDISGLPPGPSLPPLSPIPERTMSRSKRSASTMKMANMMTNMAGTAGVEISEGVCRIKAWVDGRDLTAGRGGKVLGRTGVDLNEYLEKDAVNRWLVFFSNAELERDFLACNIL
ncbi:hypothetical protein HDU67_007085 [Dinochytrium kinnereticum]|nr:hypothetical protein HDU67_007085 [Dinochytrium kinnereticum]